MSVTSDLDKLYYFSDPILMQPQGREREYINLTVKEVLDLLSKVDINEMHTNSRRPLANQITRISTNENNSHCFITNLFFRIVGLFKGRGFNTEADCALLKAKEIKAKVFQQLIIDTELLFKDEKQGYSAARTMVNINQLTKTEFNQLLKKTNFNLHKEKSIFIRFTFKHALDEEKQKILKNFELNN
jgi:hypothetical protein